MRRFDQAEALIEELEALRDKLSPYDRHWFDLEKAYVHGDNYGYYQAAVQIAQLVPYGNHEKYVVGETAVTINRAKEAAEILSQVDPEGPELKDWFSYWGYLTQALHLLGDHKKELKEARKGRKQYPDKRIMVILEFRALAALGRIEELNESLDEYMASPQAASDPPTGLWLWTGLELRAHGHREASLEVFRQALQWIESLRGEEVKVWRRFWVSQYLYASERWEEAREIYEDLYREDPNNIGRLTILGCLAARRGDREEALRISSLLEADKEPYRFGRTAFYRARIAALLGEKELAVNLLKEALAQGVVYIYLLNPVRAFIHPMMDFEPLYDYLPFQELMKPKG
jgi:tetratricopeptide (TPR) repeat protein